MLAVRPTLAIAVMLGLTSAVQSQTVYVSNYGNNTIEQFTPDGVGSVFASTGLDHPNGLAFDNAGNLYVANNQYQDIEKFTPAGVGSIFARVPDLPQGVAFDSADNLYVTVSASNMIVRVTPGGSESVFASGLYDPADVVVQPTPEPATLSLLALGGLAMVKRRRK